ncbi:murein biosynthesis integral membrane protein MurJ [Thalassotalea sp. HSM 43]|uniref:murein biosynthesis integral membrane protein MurJ n=1 Tax=Thalassotalea sp. HSM 43 TaxID=2552945 RepID=UPI001081CA23|nr:murein biosynthesis integral membrane protein MurJ [Thalassotalea sp. HSM 43]QBY03420.1 murein biosynthesis integral membrane protein MurJ [Thalassotalea sp. HSM 43]
MAKRLLKSGLIVSFMTLISRVLGLVRDIVIADKIGTSAGADVFFFANKIPNFLRRLFAEGAFAQAFVPVLSEYQHQDQANGTNESRELIAKVSGTLGVIVSVVTLFGMIASPVVVALFGFGWFVDWLNDGPNAAKFDLASSLLTITFPYLWFIALTALAGSVLNTLGKFAAAAFTPVLLNVCIILAAIFLSSQFEEPAYALAWGVFLGGLSQFLFQLPFLYRAGVLVKPSWGWRHPGVSKIRKLIVPALFGVSVTQINLLLDTLIASFLITGSISWLYYADRLLEFPLGLFGIAIATIILPSLSRLHASKDSGQFADTIGWALKVVSLLGWPAMAGLIVLAQPVIMVLFMRGEFSQQDVLHVSYALFAYMSGLISFMFIKILAPGYYARQDTKTPVIIGVKAMAANMAFNLMLAPVFGYVGLAIATALSATLNATLLYRGLAAKDIYHIDRATITIIVKLVISAAIMALALMWLSPEFALWVDMSLWQKVSNLIGLILSGAVIYFAAAAVLGLRPRHFIGK